MKKILLLMIGLAGALTRAHALDLTPHEIAAPSGGPQFTRFFFQDGSKQLVFRIDNQMTVSGGAALVTFNFRDINGAKMKIAKSPFPVPAPFGEENLKAYRESATAFVPPEATDVKLEDEQPDTIAINGWSSRQFTFTYTQFGVAQRRTVTFVTLSEQEQIVIDVGAAASDYEKAYARGFRVLNSLGEMRNGPDGPT